MADPVAASPFGLPEELEAVWAEIGSPTRVEELSGGSISTAHRITTNSGARVVLKRNPDAPADLYDCEIRGLELLGDAGMRVPHVLAVGTTFLLLEDAGGGETDWEEFGRAVARMHGHVVEQFGLGYENYSGSLRQPNGWWEDGYEFFAQLRLLSYLPLPLTEAALTLEDRRGIERVASRLRLFVPPQPPSVLHGDLWAGNVVSDPDGNPALIDPSAFHGWALGDLAMMSFGVEAPPGFLSAYDEISPLPDGWQDALAVLGLMDYLRMIAHLGGQQWLLTGMRELLDRYG